MIFLTSAALQTADVEAIASRRELTVAFATGLLRGSALAAALHCDWLAVEENAEMVIDSPRAWSGAIGRIGAHAVRRLHFLGRTTLTAGDAVREELADALVPFGADP